MAPTVLKPAWNMSTQVAHRRASELPPSPRLGRGGGLSGTPSGKPPSGPSPRRAPRASPTPAASPAASPTPAAARAVAARRAGGGGGAGASVTSPGGAATTRAGVARAPATRAPATRASPSSPASSAPRAAAVSPAPAAASPAAAALGGSRSLRGSPAGGRAALPVAATAAGAAAAARTASPAGKAAVRGAPEGARASLATARGVSPAGKAASLARSPAGKAATLARSPVGKTATLARSPVGKTATLARSPAGKAVTLARSPVGKTATLARSPVGKAATLARSPVGKTVTLARSPAGKTATLARSPAGKTARSSPAGKPARTARASPAEKAAVTVAVPQRGPPAHQATLTSTAVRAATARRPESAGPSLPPTSRPAAPALPAAVSAAHDAPAAVVARSPGRTSPARPTVATTSSRPSLGHLAASAGAATDADAPRPTPALATPGPRVPRVHDGASPMSVRRRESQARLQAAIEQDLAAWLERLLGGAATVDAAAPLLPQLASGHALWQLLGTIAPANTAAHRLHPGPLAPGDYRARDNVAMFLTCCRDLVRRSALFEVSDLVDGKRPEAVLHCLVQLARAAKARGIEPPEIVRVEDDVDLSVAQEGAAVPADVVSRAGPLEAADDAGVAPYKAVADDDVDRRLEALLAQHPHLVGRFDRIAFGTYWLRRAGGAPAKRIHVRILFDQVMVRVGGGWEDLVVFAARYP